VVDLEAVLFPLRQSAPFAAALDALAQARSVTAIDQSRGPLLAALASPDGPLWLVVVPTSRDAERLVAEVNAWRSGSAVLFPAWETLPHERLSPRAETVGRRHEAIWRVRGDDGALNPPRLVVAPVRAAIQHMVPGFESRDPVVVAKGDTGDPAEIAKRLVEIGYSRGDLVSRRGEIAVRGGLVDVFPPTAEHPVRVDFWGDEVTSVREFAVSSQRTLGEVERLVAFQCRELLPTDELRGRAIRAAQVHERLRPELNRIADGMSFEGMEALLEVLYEHPPVLRDLLGVDTRILVVEPKRTADRATEMAQEVEALAEAGWGAAAEGAQGPAEGTYADLDRALGAGPRPAITPFRSAHSSEHFELEARTWEHVHGDVPAVARDIRTLLQRGFRVVVAAETHGASDRIREILGGQDLFLPRYDGGALDEGHGAVVVAPIDEGFVSEALGLAVVGERDLFGKRRPHREPKTARRSVTTLELVPGDYVVHVTHGVGRYVGMQTREIETAKTDYIVISYAEGDRVYVPADQLDLVSKYIGGEDPKIHRIGAADWNRQKARVRKAVAEMAGELVKLYASRANATGHGFSMDQPWQRELEDAFPYVETRDQLSAIEDVKADMERAVPMDRLICGDVGYGKTEIAIRAAFKAVLDGKQVAVLVPTTLLSQQHLTTFTERFAPFPVRVASLSRFVTAKDQRRIIEDLELGKVDIVVGTHRLLQKDVKFADLGLLVVDEEQRFGVAHKEAIKKLKHNVDVLVMTATPIPRTLEMSLSGIRDLSVIDTPPEDRHPVLTFVGPSDEGQVGAAIRREMLRDGQTFFVHNQVHDIERAVSLVRKLVPEARVGVAHGQMEERRLEQVMFDFWDRAFDVLVTTTIIESGLDIPTVNTLIVDRADKLGLAQLYQLRGRVGRARERAYAYFFFPPERTLTEASHQRLAAISQFTDLGSGLQIALRDLEIRGAGNLLGGEQHGHIATVGFDLYVKLLAEAVQHAKGEQPQPKPEVQVDMPVDAHLPESWIAKEGLRLEAYRRIAEAETLEQLEDVRTELTDRYGLLPDQAETLMRIAALKIEIGPRGVRRVSVGRGKARIEPFVLSESEQVRVRRLFSGSIFKPQTYTLILDVPRTEDPAAWLLQAVRDILAP
jgi:transcription-repair coupling factor (superfamily II helicase)